MELDIGIKKKRMKLDQIDHKRLRFIFQHNTIYSHKFLPKLKKFSHPVNEEFCRIFLNPLSLDILQSIIYAEINALKIHMGRNENCRMTILVSMEGVE